MFRKNHVPIFGLFIVLSISSLTGCTSDDSEDFNLTKTLDFNAFTLETPTDWYAFTQQGIDTYIGGLTNDRDTLFFDYGYLSFGSIDDVTRDSETISFQTLRIQGYEAKLVKEKRSDRSKFRYSVYIDKRDRQNLNRIYGHDLENEPLARAIFLSHRFR